MRRDVGTVLKSDSFRIPRNFIPQLIIDFGIRAYYSTLDYNMQFPGAEIISFNYNTPNFLLDKCNLAYYDNIKFKSFSLRDNIDDIIYREIPYERQIDFIKFDIDGLEKNIFKAGGRWAKNTKYLKARLTNYDYKEAKADLHKLGFYSAAMHDGARFYVIGEAIEN
jgi:hypothetical protein